jgi:hypothetical protein
MMKIPSGFVNLGNDRDLVAAFDALSKSECSADTGIVDSPDWAIAILQDRLLRADISRLLGWTYDDRSKPRDIDRPLGQGDRQPL